MKAKVILTSVAAVGLFAACSQDDLAVVEANAPAEVAAGRVVAGKAVIKVNGDETRFSKETGAFEEGDKIGLYLMDIFTSENNDANTPDGYWEQQENWMSMYFPYNEIHTNYLYEKKGVNFVNENAQLVEGNYFLFYDPECHLNPKAYRNRRDLWKSIQSTVTLNDYTDSVQYNKHGFGGLYGNIDNQFYLDYKQIYRDGEDVDADGNLILSATLKPVLANVKLDLANQSAHKYRINEIRLYPKPGVSVPNIAYVRPSGGKDGSHHLYSEISPVFTEEDGFHYYPNLKNTFTQEMARNLVKFEKIADTGMIPYGYEGETETAPYYCVKFPESAVIDVHVGAIQIDKCFEAIFAAPLWEDFKYSRFKIYAEQWDPLVEVADAEGNMTKGAWVPGFFEQGMDHQSWYVEDCLDETNIGRLYFDDHAFTKYNTVGMVENTADLYNKVRAELVKGYVPVITAMLGTNTVEITPELNTLIESYEAAYGKDIVVAIDPVVSGHDITIAGENLLNDNYDLSAFPNGGGSTIILKADQALAEESDWSGLDFTVPAGTEVTLNVNKAKMGRVNNLGTINALAADGGVLNVNNGTATDEAVLNVPAGNKIEVRVLNNRKKGIVNVDGEIINTNPSVNKFTNNGLVNLGAEAQVTISDGNGKLDITKVPVHTDGLQNHIEVVDPSNMTIVYETSKGDLEAVSKDLKQILAAHIISGAKAFEITSTATELKKAIDTAIAAKTTVTMKNAVKVSEDTTPGCVVKFEALLTVAAGKTLELTDAEVKDVLVQDNAKLNGTIANLDGSITLKENAELGATIAAGEGTIYGYSSQITGSYPATVKVFGSL